MNIPVESPWPELNEATQTHRDLVEEHAAAIDRARAAVQAANEAQAHDKRELGAALREKRKEPSPTAPKAEAARQAAEQRRDGIAEGIRQQESVIRDLIREHQAEWQADVDRVAEKARAAAVEALDAAATACARVAEAERLRRFLENPDNPKATLRWSPPLRGLPAPHGGLHDLDAALGALRQALEPAPEPIVSRTQNGEPTTVPRSLQLMHGHAA
jgi:hypothetical protein